MKPKMENALDALAFGKWIVRKEDNSATVYSDVEWEDGYTPPTEAQVTAKLDELVAAAPLEQLIDMAAGKKAQAESEWTAPYTTEQQAYLDALDAMGTDNPDVSFDEYGEVTGFTWPTKPE